MTITNSFFQLVMDLCDDVVRGHECELDIHGRVYIKWNSVVRAPREFRVSLYGFSSAGTPTVARNAQVSVIVANYHVAKRPVL